VKVILLTDFGKLGNEGDVAKVKDGYGRNYLIPQGIALQATDSNFKKLDGIKRAKSKIVEKEKDKFLKIKEEIEKISLTIATEAKENEELYGSINEAQIFKLIKAEGIDLDKDMLVIETPIDKLGVFTVKINLHQDVVAALKVWVVKK